MTSLPSRLVSTVTVDGKKLPCINCYMQNNICMTCSYEIHRIHNKSSISIEEARSSVTQVITYRDICNMWDADFPIDPTKIYSRDSRMVGDVLVNNKLVPCARCYAFGFPCMDYQKCDCNKIDLISGKTCDHKKEYYHIRCNVATFIQVYPYSWFPPTFHDFYWDCGRNSYSIGFDRLQKLKGNY